MRPLFYSETNSSAKQQGWVRAGHHVEYNNTSLTDQIKSLPDVVRNRNYFVLSFQVEFPHQKDTCYFAHCYPYPFTRLRNYVGMCNTWARRLSLIFILLTRRLVRVCAEHRMFQDTTQGCINNFLILSEKLLGTIRKQLI